MPLQTDLSCQNLHSLRKLWWAARCMHALWNNSLQSSNTGKYPEMFVTCTTILNHLIGFKEVITVYCEIHTQHTLQKKKKYGSFLMINQLVHPITNMLFWGNQLYSMQAMPWNVQFVINLSLQSARFNYWTGHARFVMDKL
jgi:hypothetical protein